MTLFSKETLIRGASSTDKRQDVPQNNNTVHASRECSNSKARGLTFTRCSQRSCPVVRDRTHTRVPATLLTKKGPTLDTPRWVRAYRETATNYPATRDLAGYFLLNFRPVPEAKGALAYCCTLCSLAFSLLALARS